MTPDTKINYEEAKKAYEEIESVLSKYSNFFDSHVRDIQYRLKTYLRGLELRDFYKLNIEPRDVHSLDYNRPNSHVSIGWRGEKYRRTISWEDEGRQPTDELLVCFGFSTGAYIFGDISSGYPEETFKAFWQELKSYKPKYIDTVNHNMFFSIDTAYKVFNEFNTIFKKYYDLAQVDMKKTKIENMKKELAKLEENNLLPTSSPGKNHL